MVGGELDLTGVWGDWIFTCVTGGVGVVFALLVERSLDASSVPFELFDFACRGCASSSRDLFSHPFAVLFRKTAPRLYPSHSLPLRVHRAQFGSCRSHYGHLATNLDTIEAALPESYAFYMCGNLLISLECQPSWLFTPVLSDRARIDQCAVPCTTRKVWWRCTRPTIRRCFYSWPPFDQSRLCIGMGLIDG